MEDVIVIGAGAAGLTAGMYVSRYGYKAKVFEGAFAGGQAATTYEIDNYMGFENGINGAELALKMEEQAKKFGAQIVNEKVTNITLRGDVKKVTTNAGEYTARALILAMGALPKKLGVKGENEFAGRGVSYCATCDGGFFKGKDVVVAGGGDTALEDAIFLSEICTRVYLVHRRDEFRANAKLVNTAKSKSNIQFILNSNVTEILGKNILESVTVNTLGRDTALKVSGVFIAVGTKPETEILKGKMPLSEQGYIVVNENMETDIKGVFAAGDVVKKPLRQIVTAVADGAVSAYSAVKYISEG